MQIAAKGGVVAVGRVGKDRRRRHLPAGRLLAEVGGERGLRLEADPVGDLRLLPPLAVVAPLLGQVEAPAERQRAPLTNRVHAHRDLAVADLAERARVLPLHSRRVLAVLDDPGVIDHPRQHADLGRHPLGTATHEHHRIPGRVGQKLLHRLVAGGRLLEPKQRRLQTLAAPMLDQAAHVQERVLTLPPKRQRLRHLFNETSQPLAHADRRTLRLQHRFHPLLLRTMTAYTDAVRRGARGPFNELTKSY